MFEYDGFVFRVWGFLRVKCLEEQLMIFLYKRKMLVIKGSGLRAINFMDNSVEIKGLINLIEFQYKGECDV